VGLTISKEKSPKSRPEIVVINDLAIALVNDLAGMTILPDW
jgi:hypothetical protein